MRRIMLAVLLLAFPIVAIFGCKKGGPAQPYDAKLPNTTGNMVVGVSQEEASGTITAQKNITIKVTDYLGSVFSKETDYTGMVSFNFDYAKYSVDQAAPLFKIEIPKQGHYNDTICDYVLKDGPNTFLFTNDPVLSVAPSSGMPLSYSYNITNNICYNLVYDKGGNGDIPISLAAQNVPSGWTVNYENQILGGSVTQTAVTFLIPQGEYRQHPISFLGYFENGPVTASYVDSAALTIMRAFKISLDTSTAVTISLANDWYSGCNFLALRSSGFHVSNTNGANITWNYYYKLSGNPAGNCGNAYIYTEKNGSFVGGGDFIWPDSGHDICLNTGMSEELHIWNNDVGDYHYLGGSIATGGSSTNTVTYSQDHGTTLF
jgi:hypothetical protein